MISNHDRSYWIGASDTSFVVGNWNTKTFDKWWATKLGLKGNDFVTEAMQCGNAFEHRILDFLPCQKDEQLRMPELRLRVNYDGTSDNTIYEVKTHKADKEFKVSKNYWRQAQVEMFCFYRVKGILPKLFMASYPLGEKEYKNFFCDIDKSKLQLIPIEYDASFISNEYLPRLKILCECLEKGKYPTI